MVLFTPSSAFNCTPESLPICAFAARETYSILPYPGPRRTFSTLRHLLRAVNLAPFMMKFVNEIVKVYMISSLNRLFVVGIEGVYWYSLARLQTFLRVYRGAPFPSICNLRVLVLGPALALI